MNKKNITITICVAAMFAGAGFFGGVQYQKTKRVTFQAGNMMLNPRTGNGAIMARTGTFRNGMQPVTGDITAIDDKSITVKTTDGSSKIVIYSETTKFNRTQEGKVSDLKNGERVMIFGSTNSDGSVTAQNISVGGMFEIK